MATQIGEKLIDRGREVFGVNQKEKAAGHGDYAELAYFELIRRMVGVKKIIVVFAVLSFAIFALLTSRYTESTPVQAGLQQGRQQLLDEAKQAHEVEYFNRNK